MNMTNYDNWIFRDPNEQTPSENMRDREIDRIMDKYNLDYDDASSHFAHMVSQAEKDHIACLAEDY